MLKSGIMNNKVDLENTKLVLILNFFKNQIIKYFKLEHKLHLYVFMYKTRI